MNLDSYIQVGTGLAYTFVGYGALNHFVLTSGNSDIGKCTRVNLILGLNSVIATGILQVYSGLRR
jgi:hypothetical protein